MQLKRDSRVHAFPAFFVTGTRSKTELRCFVARHALHWLRMQAKRGSRGAIMVDIDDTLIDGNESVQHGFEHMRDLYLELSLTFPMHIVTARPISEHDNVMRMMRKRGFCIPPDRLHMLSDKDYYHGDSNAVERFKWGAYKTILKQHGKVLARFGDKLWDVAHYDSLTTTLAHVEDKDCYLFRDPKMPHTYSAKLPGRRD